MQVFLGVIPKNENEREGMIQIMEQLQKYVSQTGMKTQPVCNVLSAVGAC